MTDTQVQEGNKLIAVVYRITNTLNGKCYVGSTVRFDRRKKRHFEDLKSGNHHCKPLQRAFDKYGNTYFIMEILESFPVIDKQNILQREQYYIETLMPQYNVCKIAGSQLGAIRDENFRRKCSERMAGNRAWNKGLKTGKQPLSTVNKRRNSMTGKSIPLERRIKIAIANSNPVLQKDLKGNTVKEWSSLKEVSLLLPCSHGRLSQYLSGKSNIQTFKGFIWTLKK